MTAHIVAMGGGGFSMSPLGAPTNLDRYLVELTGKSSPLVCFAPTASADDPQYINKFLLAYGTLGVRTMMLTLWEGGSAGSVARLADADLLVVGGGHTVNLMALWQAHGVDRALKARYAAGDVVLAGVSAGGSCWYEGCITDSFGDFRPWRGGLGILSRQLLPALRRRSRTGPGLHRRCRRGQPARRLRCRRRRRHPLRGRGRRPTSSPRPPASASTACMPSDLPTASGVLVEPQQMTVL